MKTALKLPLLLGKEPNIRLLFSDDFTGENGSSLSDGWTDTVGTFDIQSNRAAVKSANSYRAFSVRSCNKNDVIIESKCMYASGSIGVIARYNDANNFWMAQVSNSGKFSIFVRIGGSFTEVASTPFTPVYGTQYTIRFTAIGKNFSATINGGNEISYYADYAVLDGPFYIGIRGSMTEERFDDFKVWGFKAPNTYLYVANPTDRLGYGIFEWFQKPAAVRYVGTHDRTYISWVNLEGNIRVRYYDHDTSELSSIYTADNLLETYGTYAVDDHNAPMLRITPGGKIQLYYFVHDINAAFFLKESTSAEDISAWGSRVSLSDGDYQHSYPQVKRESDGTLTLFYRRGAFSSSAEYYKQSTDEGVNWGAPVKIIDFGASTGVYVFATIRNDIMHLAWNKATDAGRWNIYYAKSVDGGASWIRSDGSAYTLPITEENAEVVYNSGADHCYCWDIRADADDNPHIVFTTKLDPNNEFRFAKLETGSWKTYQITTSSLLYGNSTHFYSGGVVIDPENVYRVALAKKSSRLEVETWISVDSGATWALETAITSGSMVDNFRIQWVENYADDLPLVWCHGIYTGISLASEWDGYRGVTIQCNITNE